MSQTNDWLSAGDSHTGNIRPVNEDNFLDSPERRLWMVADGMGGHTRGDIASRMIGEHLGDIAIPRNLDDAVGVVVKALREVNARLITMRDRDPRRRISGSTFAMLLAVDDEAAVVWVGDSRVYRSRAGQLEQLTRDHSRVNELIEAGLISEEQAETHPEANVITRAVGADDELLIDCIHLDLKAGDRFLLCTDGLYREVELDELASRLRDGKQPSTINRRLMSRVLAGPARDNLTVVTVVNNGAAAA